MNFSAPPRRLPLSLAIVNVLNPFAQIGWFVLGFSSVFFWAFVMNGDYPIVTFRGPITRTTGTVRQVERTGASEGRRPVMANHYEYSVADRLLSGVSYSSGQTVDPGDRVTVEYLPSDPTRSRIAGMRRAEFGAGVLFVVIFPLVGLLMAVFSMKFGASRNHFLRQGLFTTGVLKNKRATNVTVNNRPVYELTFEFTARDGSRRQARTSTSSPERLEDERQEPLLYDPEKPGDAYMLDSLPARPQLDGLGELQGRGVAAVLALILPAIVIAANAYVAMRWLR